MIGIDSVTVDVAVVKAVVVAPANNRVNEVSSNQKYPKIYKLQVSGLSTFRSILKHKQYRPSIYRTGQSENLTC